MSFLRRLAIIALLLSTVGESPAAPEDLSVRNVARLSLEELMDVRVTAPTRMEERIGDIAASVTLVTRADIERHGHRSLQEVLAHLPGMYLVENTESIFLGVRGIAGGGVLFLVNGVPQHPSQQKIVTMSDVAQFDVPVGAIDRIEIVRSPVATVYGNGAFQGLVNVVTDDRASAPALVQASYGERATRRMFLRTGFAREGVDLVLNASHETSGGLTGDYRDMLAVWQRQGLSPAARTSMDGDFDSAIARLGASGHVAGTRFDVSFARRDYGIYPTSVGLGGENDVHLTTWQASLQRHVPLGEDFELRARAVLSKQTYEIPSMSIMQPSTVAEQSQGSRRTDLELDLVHHRGAMDVVWGYRLRAIDDVRNDFFFSLDPQGAPLEDVVSTLDTQWLHDVYQQMTLRLADRWRLAGGVRYQRLPDAYTGARRYPSRGETVAIDAPIADRNLVTGRASLQFDPAAGHRLRVLAGTASQHRENVELTDPEEIVSYELGHSYTTHGVRIATSVFLNDIDRIALRVLELSAEENAAISRITSDHSWRSFGVESIVRWRPGSRWRLSASAVAQRTRDRDDEVDVGYSPALTAKGSAEYHDGRFGVGLHGRWVGAMQAGYEIVDDGAGAPAVNRIGDEVDGFFTVGGRVRYDFTAGAFLAVEVSNLFDADVRYPANELTNMWNGLIGMGRVVTVSLGATGW